jgi:hypothetical protein
MFPPELERDAFRADNEFGWTRAQIPMVVDVLRHKGLAILGRELWWEAMGRFMELSHNGTGCEVCIHGLLNAARTNRG